MRSKQKKIRLAVSGLLLAAVVGTGIYAYQADQNYVEELKEQAQLPDAEEVEEFWKDVNTSSAEADLPEEEPESTPVPEDTPVPEPSAEPEGTSPAAGNALVPSLSFDENTVLAAPMTGTSGEVLIPYNMEHTVYFPTLDAYKCSPGMVMAAEVGTPVMAVADSLVTLVENHEETGLTVTMDMGDGYQVVYGQLKDVTVEPGQQVEASAVIGAVNEPTKYYVEEGSSLYFAMTKDGQPIDPTLYLPPMAE